VRVVMPSGDLAVVVWRLAQGGLSSDSARLTQPARSPRRGCFPCIEACVASRGRRCRRRHCPWCGSRPRRLTPDVLLRPARVRLYAPPPPPPPRGLVRRTTFTAKVLFETSIGEQMVHRWMLTHSTLHRVVGAPLMRTQACRLVATGSLPRAGSLQPIRYAPATCAASARIDGPPRGVSCKSRLRGRRGTRSRRRCVEARITRGPLCKCTHFCGVLKGRQSFHDQLHHEYCASFDIPPRALPPNMRPCAPQHMC